MTKKKSPATNWRFVLPLALLLGAAGWFLWPQQSRFLSTDSASTTDGESENGSESLGTTEVVLMRRTRSVAQNTDDKEFREQMLARDRQQIVSRERKLKNIRRIRRPPPMAPVDYFAKREESLKEAAMLGEGDPKNPRSIVTAARLALREMEEDAP